MSFFPNNTSRRTQWIAAFAVIILLYGLFISTLSTHPAGSYVDESCEAYNAYLIAKTGTAENGTTFPLFFQCYTQGYTQWMSPVLMYMMTGMYLIVPPSILSARIFSATIVFAAMLLIGLLAFRISGRKSVGVVVTLLAMTTPWLFEISRLIQETSPLVFSIVLFLFVLHRASRQIVWRLQDCVLIALSLGLITYSYAAGRVLAPLFGLALLVFVRNWQSLVSVTKVGVLYTLSLIPFFVVYFTNPKAINGRFHEVTNLRSPSLIENIGTVLSALNADVSLKFFIFEGDYHVRHHIAGIGEFLVGTLVLGCVGLLVVLFKHIRNTWWQFIIVGSVISLLPGALTTERYHALRGIAFPIFVITLTIPTIAWLMGFHPDTQQRSIDDGHADTQVEINPNGREVTRKAFDLDNFGRKALLVGLLTLSLVQAVLFFARYMEVGDNRSFDFDAAYPRVFAKALEQPERPIYLDDGFWGPMYIHAYWYATINSIDPSIFVHLLDNEFPPVGALVLSTERSCTNCETLMHEEQFLLYRNSSQSRSAVTTTANSTSFSGQMGKSFGISADSDGNLYVADSQNARIRKFDPDGKPIFDFGVQGAGSGMLTTPHGIAVNLDGDIFVTDSFRHTLLRFRADGTFVKEWLGPETPLYGPRDLAFGPNGLLYIIDQGRVRVVRFDPSSEQFMEWGRKGSGPGEFEGISGIGIGGGQVLVTDAVSNRVQVFDLDGSFLRQWEVPQWDNDLQSYPDIAFDDISKTVYVSSGKSNLVIAYDDNGRFIKFFSPQSPNQLQRPSGLVLVRRQKEKRLLVLNAEKGEIIAMDISNSGDPK